MFGNQNSGHSIILLVSFGLLMNLLNGLAVSDITDLTKRAEIVTIQQK